ncbi:hypothetical protein Btru_019168 [Bulinus truncatus]|nr:hypothetical protein Btru_019168 [Bulinus truncatus]
MSGNDTANETTEEQYKVLAVAREELEAPPGPVGAVIANGIRNYLHKTGIEKQFHSILHLLLSRDELPYNPYPGVATRLRPYMEKFLIDKEKDEKIEFILSVPLRETRLLDLFTTQEGGPVWGLRSILRVIDTSVINRYRWLSNNITPSFNDLYQREGYSNQVMVALVGAAIFHGSFYRQVHIAQYRLEFFITGNLLDEGISIFVNSVILDVDNLSESKHHILIGLNVPVQTENVWQLEFWDPESIQSHKGELLQKMCDAVMGNKYIIAECVFQMDPVKPIYIQGQKQYTLSFMKIAEDKKEEGLDSLSQEDHLIDRGMSPRLDSLSQEDHLIDRGMSPRLDSLSQEDHLIDHGMSSRLDSLFQEDNLIDHGMSPRLDSLSQEDHLIDHVMSPRLDSLSQEDHLIYCGTSCARLSNFAEFPMASLHEGVFLNQTHAESYISLFSSQLNMIDYANVRQASAQPKQSSQSIMNRKLLTMVEDDYHYIHRHVHQRLQHEKPRRALIDGFRLGDDPGSGAFAWQITSPIKSNLQKRIVNFDVWAQLFDIAYHLILLVLMERKTTDMSLLIELYKLCNGTAGRLHMLGEKNKAVRALIRGFMNRPDGHKVRQFLQEYKNEIDELLAMSLHERSSDLRAVGKALSSQVAELMDVSDQQLGSASHLSLTMLAFRDQQNYILTTLMRISEDCLYWCPLIKAQIEELHKRFPDAVPKQTSYTRDPISAGPRDSIAKETVMKHGFEDEHIMKHEDSVIVVSKCMEKDVAPKIMSKESVLMKYIIDIHMDEMWETFLEETFKENQPPANPYPSFITLCRASAMRMDLCFEQESAVLDRMLTKMAQLVDPENFIYQLPACEGCGPATAIALLDPGGYLPLTQCIKENLINKAYLQRKGPYKIGICLGITGPSSLYGKMFPYLNQLDLVEHYYIQGPTGCQTDAAQLFAVMIQKHIWDLVNENKVPILGVFIGRDKTRWSWEEVINKKMGFFNEVEMVAYYLMDGWRYIPVVKHFLLHYMQEGEQGTQIFFEDDPLQFYTTVFSSVERAAFHYQNGGPIRGGNPLSSSNMKSVLAYLDNKLLQLREKSDFMEVHRLLLYRSLLSDNTDNIVEAWRMFHSIAGQAEYAACLAQSLAELVEFEIEFSKFFSIENSETQGSESYSKTGASPLNMGAINAMLRALIEKADVVFGWKVSMVNSSMQDFIKKKINSVVETDVRTSNIYPIINENTVELMEEIQNMLLNIKTTASCDVHNMSENALTTMWDIEKTEHQRPVSVESQLLNDHQMFLHRPKAGHTILDDDYLYRPKRQQMFKPKVEF